MAGPDGTASAGVRYQDFAQWDTQLPALEEMQALADDTDQAIGKLRANAALNFRWKRHAQPAQRLSAIRGVHRREHQVPGFGRVEREPHDIGGAHLPNDQYIWILAQGIDDALLEARRVRGNLPLSDER